MPLKYTGVNWAGGDFTPKTLPGTLGQQYYYPTNAELDYFLTRGLKDFRIPFKMERIGRKSGDTFTFNDADVAHIDRIVKYIVDAGGNVVLDPHNYGRYNGSVIGSSGFSIQFFADFWAKMAERYSFVGVIFGLMNEPHDLPDGVWVSAVMASMSAIRATGAKNLILVPGDNWTSAYNFVSTGNAAKLRDIVKADINAAMETHTYFDPGHEGNEATAISPTIGVERNEALTADAKAHGYRLWCGEVGAGDNNTALDALDNLLEYMEDNDDVWIGVSYWDAQRWNQSYYFNCYSSSGAEKPQLSVLLAHKSGDVADPPSDPPNDEPTDPPTDDNPNEEPTDPPDDPTEPTPPPPPPPPELVKELCVLSILHDPTESHPNKFKVVRNVSKDN